MFDYHHTLFVQRDSLSIRQMQFTAPFAQLELGFDFGAVQEQDYDIGHKQEVHGNMVVVHNHKIIQEDGGMDGNLDNEPDKELD